MRDGTVVWLSIAAAVALGGAAAAAAVRWEFFLGPEPVLVVVSLLVGVALPQYLLYRRDGSAGRLGIAAFAVAAVVGTLLAGALQFVVYGTRLGDGLLPVFLLLVAGALLGSVVRAFLAGYRERTA